MALSLQSFQHITFETTERRLNDMRVRILALLNYPNFCLVYKPHGIIQRNILIS